MSITKGFLAILLLTALLCMLLPSPAFAGLDEGDWVGVIAVVAILVIIIGIYKVWEWDGFFDVNPGDMFINIQTDLPTSQPPTSAQDLRSVLNRSVDYNIDWLLSERREGRAWVGAGFTFEVLPVSGDIGSEDYHCGSNFILGYREGSWDHKWFVQYFRDGEFQTSVEITYRF